MLQCTEMGHITKKKNSLITSNRNNMDTIKRRIHDGLLGIKSITHRRLNSIEFCVPHFTLNIFAVNYH